MRPNQPTDRAAQKTGYPFGQIILVCIHTAMRRGEVGALERSYVTEQALHDEIMSAGVLRRTAA